MQIPKIRWSCMLLIAMGCAFTGDANAAWLLEQELKKVDGTNM